MIWSDLKLKSFKITAFSPEQPMKSPVKGFAIEMVQVMLGWKINSAFAPTWWDQNISFDDIIDCFLSVQISESLQYNPVKMYLTSIVIDPLPQLQLGQAEGYIQVSDHSVIFSGNKTTIRPRELQEFEINYENVVRYFSFIF